MSADETLYFIAGTRDLRIAREGLDRLGIPYRTEPWQPHVTAIYVPADADVSKVFGLGVGEDVPRRR